MTAAAAVEVREDAERHRFELLRDGTVAGHLRYRLRGETYALIHTEIDPQFEGLGLGSTLVRSVLDDLRDRPAGVLPYCPFVRAYLDRHPEYVELVPVDQSASFGLPGPDVS